MSITNPGGTGESGICACFGFGGVGGVGGSGWAAWPRFLEGGVVIKSVFVVILDFLC